MCENQGMVVLLRVGWMEQQSLKYTEYTLTHVEAGNNIALQLSPLEPEIYNSLLLCAVTQNFLNT